MTLNETAPVDTPFAADDVSRALAGANKTAAETAYPAIKYSEFYHTTAATVEGNGRTIINVFYRRIVYTVIFDKNATNAQIIVNGVEYQCVANPDKYQLKVKLDQSMINYWPKPTEIMYPGGGCFEYFRTAPSGGINLRCE